MASHFHRTYPENCTVYHRACSVMGLAIGEALTVELHRPKPHPQFIINVPTKEHWRDPSKLEWIDQAMTALISEVLRLGITTIGIPALGCGKGGLRWLDVWPRMEAALRDLSVEADCYEPELWC